MNTHWKVVHMVDIKTFYGLGIPQPHGTFGAKALKIYLFKVDTII